MVFTICAVDFAVNGEVLRCSTVQTSMDHQLEHYSIWDVKPNELLMEQLTETLIVYKFACVAGDAHGSIKHSL